MTQVLYPGPARPSRPRDRSTADARLRRDGVVPRRVGGGGGRPRRAHEGLDARREPRRRREPHRAPAPDDPCLDRERPVRLAAEPRSALGGIESADDLVADLEQALAPFRAGLAASTRSRSSTRSTCSTRVRPERRLLRRRDRRRPRALRLRADAVHPGSEGRARGARPRARRHPPSAPLPHPLRPRRRRGRARARAPVAAGSRLGDRCPASRRPRRLESSARRLYGDSFDRLWGELVPIPEDNIAVVGDDVLGLECFPSTGHASHHVSMLHEDGTLYAGDSAGVRIAPGGSCSRRRLRPISTSRRGSGRSRRPSCVRLHGSR